MILRSMLIWMLLVIPAGFALYKIKYEVVALEEELDQIEATIKQDREATEVLRAEWSYLNEPGRIEALSRRHLGLTPATATRVAHIEDIPFRTLPKPAAPETPGPTPASVSGGTGAAPAPAPASAPRQEAPLSHEQASAVIDGIVAELGGADLGGAELGRPAPAAPPTPAPVPARRPQAGPASLPSLPGQPRLPQASQAEQSSAGGAPTGSLAAGAAQAGPPPQAGSKPPGQTRASLPGSPPPPPDAPAAPARATAPSTPTRTPAAPTPREAFPGGPSLPQLPEDGRLSKQDEFASGSWQRISVGAVE